MDNIAMVRSSASYEDIDNKKNIKHSKKTKEREDNGNKRRKNSPLYCNLQRENNGYTSRECKVLKARAADKKNHKYGNNYYKKKLKEINIL